MMDEVNFRNRSQSVRQAARAHLLEVRQARLAKRMTGKTLRLPLPAMPIAADLRTPTEAELLQRAPMAEATGLVEPSEVPDQSVPLEIPVVETTPETLRRIESTSPEELVQADPLLHDLTETPIPQTPLSDPVAPPIPDPVTDGLYNLAVQTAAMAEIGSGIEAAEQTVDPSPHVQPVEGAAPEALPERMAPEPALPSPTPEAQPVPDVVDPPLALGQIMPVTERPSDLHSLPGAGPGLIWMLQQCDIHTLQDLAVAEAAELTPKLGLIGQILNVQTWLDYAKGQVDGRTR